MIIFSPNFDAEPQSCKARLWLVILIAQTSTSKSLQTLNISQQYSHQSVPNTSVQSFNIFIGWQSQTVLPVYHANVSMAPHRNLYSLRSLMLSQWWDSRTEVISKNLRALTTLQTTKFRIHWICLRILKTVVQWIKIIKFEVNNRGGNGILTTQWTQQNSITVINKQC